MAPRVSRASFLPGGFRNEVRAIRPPWAPEDAAFTALCDGCLRCVSACPEKIIVAGRGGLPEMNFAAAGCSFCGDCVAACPSAALADRGQAPWHHKAQVGSDCLSWQGVVCRLCRDRCVAMAISFRPALGGYALPAVDAAACTGCGLCVGACPVEAVEMARAAS